MRIIAGRFRGRTLFAPGGNIVRPTGDRLKESIFNILGDRLSGAVVLDLFAGTGAMGLEALSRGADFAVFIDRHKAALAAIHRNIAAMGLSGQTQVLNHDIFKKFPMLDSSLVPFEVAFLDPPYARGMVIPALSALHKSRNLNPGATVLIEHTVQEPLAMLPAQYAITDQRKYGKSLVTFLNYML